ncbi:molecular chaperone [Rhodoferax sp.]|uniref:fimbrial biogenesis chaperone n=1 Tax=Rhodoferax sp. TaxID=50421 RepID=UPI00374DF4BC
MAVGIARLLRYATGWALAIASPSWSGELTILPTRIEFGANRGVQSVLLTNTSSQTVTVETQVQVWPEGAAGQLDNDVVVTPAVVTLPPNQRMRLRIGLLRPTIGDTERAYRLYFTELTSPAPLQGMGIGVRLRIGIPVFVPPTQPQPKPLKWTAYQDAEGWRLVARNEGNTHRRTAQLMLVGSGETSRIELPSNYVLAHSTLTVPVQGNVPPGSRVRWLEGDDERESPIVLP